MYVTIERLRTYISEEHVCHNRTLENIYMSEEHVCHSKTLQDICQKKMYVTLTE